jgi:hypothetical protein
MRVLNPGGGHDAAERAKRIIALRLSPRETLLLCLMLHITSGNIDGDSVTIYMRDRTGNRNMAALASNDHGHLYLMVDLPHLLRDTNGLAILDDSA